MDSVKTKRVKVAVYPAVAYSPETKFNIGAIGFIVINKENSAQGFHRPTSITPYVAVTTLKQVLIKSDFDIYRSNGDNVKIEARYFDFPDKYFGVGNDTNPDKFSDYDNLFVRLEGSYMKQWNNTFFGGIQYDIQVNKIRSQEANDLLEMESPIGARGGRNIGLGPGIQYDTRNSSIYPTEGQLLNFSVMAFGKFVGSEYNYVKYSFDYRRYFELLGPKNILAFQFKTDFTSGDNIPFYKLFPLGGGGRLRGIENRNLYRDQQSAYFQVEARQELFWRLGGVVFAGVGEVFESFQQFGFNDLRYVYGVGGRFQAIKGEKLNIRMDLGFTDNGQHAFYLSVREAF